ncbi:MAG: DNA translocase FtsK 4TM domain-containing protein, partial [Hyphomicrobium sp.]|nr:DNA translocase FtsK 4TM domain-containing protein [Hyphomicrobium sp.]
MSLDTRGIDPQRLLPQSVEDRLLSWLSRASGVLLLAGAALVWASLVSWSVNDPSLTHATTGTPLNWLGPIGAILSDLLLQTLGFAIVIALIAPLLWGVELWRQDQIIATPHRTKLGYLPLAILAIAGAMSSLPVVQAWPLHHGYGGVVGDGVFRLCSNLFAIVSSTRGGLAAGIALWGLSMTLGARALGIDLENVATALSALLRNRLQSLDGARRRPDVGDERGPTAGHQTWKPFATANGQPLSPPQSEQPPQSQYGQRGYAQQWPHPTADWMANVPDLGGVRPTTVLRDDPASTHGDADFHPVGVPPRRSYANPLTAAISSSSASAIDDEAWSPAAANVDLLADRGGSFDQFTDEASREIAKRFAPPSVEQPEAPIKSDNVNAIKKVEQKASTLMGAPVRRAAESDWKRPSLNLLKRPMTAKAGPEFTQT